jgi:polygalacturonase
MSRPPSSFDIRDHGATGDGHTLDTDAINAAIEAAAAAGGGTVLFPAGRYACHSLHLRSHVTLELSSGATLLAAPAPDRPDEPGYDLAEPNPWGDLHAYQDFGHSHWRNSLLWGEDLENIAIVGPGHIDGTHLGKGLSKHSSERPGTANKAIALKNCRRVTLRDFSLYRGGHFAVLATGVDDLTIDNLRIDTNRDGLDIDCCRWVRISNCLVNTVNDDAIVLKTSYALGERRATENVTITNCVVSGYDLGSVLDGTYRTKTLHAPDRDGPTGRIKLGTESHGDFRNITIANCVFDRSRGLAIESVDGAHIENIVATGLAMRNLSSSVLFIRLGNRARGPAGTSVGSIRRVTVSHVVASGVDGRFPLQLQGLPGHPIEEVRLSDFQIEAAGGTTLDEVATQPTQRVNRFFLQVGEGEGGVTGAREPFAVPLRERAYPEPSMFGLLPASALYARHVRELDLRDLRFRFATPDERPPVVLVGVEGCRARGVCLGTDAPPVPVLLEECARIDFGSV